jgi:predicted transcriptional regulator
MRVFDGRQLTAARALADLSLDQLADLASVTRRTVHRLETGGAIHVAPRRRHGHVSQDVWGKLIDALAHTGVELVPENGEHGAGARWMQPRARRDVL